MKFARRILGNWRAQRPKVAIRRVILVGIDGLDSAQIDANLEQGLLPNLALLSDIGTQARWQDSAAISNLICGVDAVRELGVRTKFLTALPPRSDDLAAICQADRDQQERLWTTLTRARRGLIAAVFDMPSQLRRLFGPAPSDADRQVIRDVHVRMDEVVGKAFSFVDERTALLVAIAARSESSGLADPATGLAFSNHLLEGAGSSEFDVPTAVSALLGVPIQRE